jgi:hypothetical protein
MKIYRGLRFLNEHGDVCEFRHETGSGYWDGIWLTSSTNKYRVGEHWVGSQSSFDEQLRKDASIIDTDVIERKLNPGKAREKQIVKNEKLETIII